LKAYSLGNEEKIREAFQRLVDISPLLAESESNEQMGTGEQVLLIYIINTVN
jgi:hypothetical protein